MMCGACSSNPQIVTATEMVYIPPPEYLLEPCAKSVPPTNGTNRDLLQFAINLGLDIDACNERIKLIKEWNAQR